MLAVALGIESLQTLVVLLLTRLLLVPCDVVPQVLNRSCLRQEQLDSLTRRSCRLSVDPSEVDRLRSRDAAVEDSRCSCLELNIHRRRLVSRKVDIRHVERLGSCHRKESYGRRPCSNGGNLAVVLAGCLPSRGRTSSDPERSSCCPALG